MDQKETVKRVFTQAADAYAARKATTDRVSHEFMLKLSGVKPADRVLDVATGPGFIAMLFAEKAKEVVGVDLTPAFVAKAQATSAQRGLRNVSFREADIEQLPFAEGSFDIVTCHKALHHFPHPSKALAEMRRVLKRGGRLVLGDSLSSNDSATAQRHNELERLRDPSHVEMYGPKKFEALIEQASFRVEKAQPFEDERDVEDWQRVMPSSEETYGEIREQLIASIPDNRFGLSVRLEGDKLFFRRRQIVVVAVKI